MKARKSTSKPKSITSDTRLTNSNILNFSSFQNTNLQKSIDPRDNYFNSNIQDSDKKEVQFLRFKNHQL